MKATLKEKMFMLLFAGVLILLFLISSTNLIIKEKKKEIYRVSVIVEDSKEDYYVNLKKGMDQAALEHNIDVNFITLYERNNSEQQKELMLREMEVGTQAIVLAPVDYAKMAVMFSETTVDIPIIILNNEESTGDEVMANVTMDYFQAGQLLAEDITRNLHPDSAVYLFTEGLQYGSNRRLYDGLMSSLPEAGHEVLLIEKAFKNRFTQVMEERVLKEQQAAVIALDIESLMEVAGIIENQPERFREISLFGSGSTLKILRYMEDGIIDGIIAENMYDAGYLCMEEAVEAIDNKRIKATVRLNGVFLDKDDITKKEYEKMLYPIG